MVKHRELILPQLSANGVAAHNLHKLSGFSAKFGPIRASDLVLFLQRGKADEAMRSVTFSLAERAVLIPLEICMLWKQLAIACVLFFVLSAISPEIFSLRAGLERFSLLIYATLTAVAAGAVVTPLLLPWIPARQFWLKGAVVGALLAFLYLAAVAGRPNSFELLSMFLWICGCSSYLAMNFTGSTVFTSLSGVKKEMTRGLKFQLICTAAAVICWVAAPF
ncbi:hypothetical protein SAMN05660330_03318 [Desulforhopalus singaporensis]|uniref:Uncharacterized protein n=1 Tax=Desulforhopalus singaporensis TaxID=91360 RepID=A0A1H0TZL8_9BACT|nr:hypothetical protein SAMN05660330_03318 [Desulforhopalus singaporensis]